MTYAHLSLAGDPETLPRMPAWVTPGRSEALEDVAFLSGAALSHLYGVMGCEGVPHALLRDRLALRAAASCVVFSGRSERSGELRDAVHLLRPGDSPGPAGAIYQHWQQAAARPITVNVLQKALPHMSAENIAAWLDVGQGGPVGQAAATLEAVLTAFPREEAGALILADAALARAIGWPHLLPLLAAGIKRRDLRKTGDDLRLACHKAVRASASEAVRMAADLTRRAERLRAIAPKLRAKGAGEAVVLFLSRDAVTPSVALTSTGMTDRAARRLCDRLVDLGAVRELTGRATFRLYGL